jgi:hypothetical protein
MDSADSAVEAREDSFDVHRAAQRTILYGILPLWIVPGFLDYLFHRKSSIETTSGTHESLIHALQMTSVGIPTLMALIFEVDASVIATIITSAAVHEALTIWDVAYAEPLRRPEPNEQHVHSFLEVLPIMATVSLLTLHPKQTAALFGRGKEQPRWSLRLKAPTIRLSYIAAVLGAIGALLVIPYAEEFVRCYRTDGTLAAHHKPDDASSSAA